VKRDIRVYNFLEISAESLDSYNFLALLTPFIPFYSRISGLRENFNIYSGNETLLAVEILDNDASYFIYLNHQLIN